MRRRRPLSNDAREHRSFFSIIIPETLYQLLLAAGVYISSLADRREAGSGRLTFARGIGLDGDLDEEDEWSLESNSEARAWSVADGPFKPVSYTHLTLPTKA